MSFGSRSGALVLAFAAFAAAGEHHPVATTPEGPAADSPAAPVHWPSFRGPSASGVADGTRLPNSWSGVEGTNVAWKIEVPGLAHSSPIVWGEKVFVTTAISGRDDAEFKYGIYGSGTTAKDRVVEHRWELWCIDKATGKVRWKRLAHQGRPRSGRHIKSTYANQTPATDGEVVVAFFGSEGLYAYDLDGKPLWGKDLGQVSTSAYDFPGYEWGAASSPILWNGLVIVQADHDGDDFVAAFDAVTGEERWRTARDELPSWGTPTVVPGPDGPELVTNASNFIRGYDPATGRELWRLGGSSQITSPTPIAADGLIVVTSGRRPTKPLFALRAGARGDITLADGETANRHVAWSRTGRGPYMPTPLAYGEYLYTLNNDGVFSCYRLADGEEMYRQRVGHRGSGFSASPVAADGKIYLAGEDGEIFVVAAGPEYRLEATNSMGEVLMATPALSDGLMLVRGRHHLFAVGR